MRALFRDIWIGIKAGLMLTALILSVSYTVGRVVRFALWGI